MIDGLHFHVEVPDEKAGDAMGRDARGRPRNGVTTKCRLRVKGEEEEEQAAHHITSPAQHKRLMTERQDGPAYGCVMGS